MLKSGLSDVQQGIETRARNPRYAMIASMLAVLLIAVGFTSAALGQAQNTGTISGNIMDPQARVVVGAKIELANTATDSHRIETSNAKGEYLFSDVAVGDYIMTITASGFETSVVEGLHVNSDSNVRQDTSLKPGSVTDQVTVESAGTTLDTRSATLGSLIDRAEVENLPIDGNNVVSLTALLPGVSNVNAPTTFTSDTAGPTFNISGSRNNQNLFLLDGQLWNNLFYNTGLNFPPHLALQEISILLNNYKAQYGRNVGSIMNVLTRSGTNKIHGTAWEYVQNKSFNASDYISKLNPHLVQNQFGVTVGGPIRRDKIFFFLAVQDLRVAQDVFTSTETLTPLERGYDVAPTATTPGVGHPCQFAGFAGHNCANFVSSFAAGSDPNASLQNPIASSTNSGPFLSQVQAAWQQAGNSGASPCVTALSAMAVSIAAPFTTKYLPYSEVPDFCFNPVSVNLLNKYIPYPNGVNTGGIPVANITAKQPRNDWDGLARTDFNLGRHTVDARFYITNANDVTSNSASNTGSTPGIATYGQDYNTGGIYYGNIGDTWVLTPSVLNVFRVGYKRYNYTINPSDHTTLQDLGSNIFQPAVIKSLPQITVQNRFKVGSQNSSWSFTVNEDEELDDNLSWTRGNHNFQFGAQYLHLQYLHRFDATPALSAGVTYTKADASDFLTGVLVSMSVANLTNLGALQNAVYTYAQDDWRLTSRLTLNYGVRYEMPFAWHSADGQGITFSPGYQSTRFPTAPLNLGYEGDPGTGNATVRSRFNNVSPRFGFAYDIAGNGKTLFRGGFGLFFDALNASVVGVGSPFNYSANYTASEGGISQPLLGQPSIAPNYVKGSAIFSYPLAANYVSHNLATPYTMAINLGFQRRVTSSGIFELNYVGKLGRHQIVQLDHNYTRFDCTGTYYQANPVYCPGTVSGSGASLSYTLSSTTASLTQQSRVVYPGFAAGGQGVVDNASIATSNYHGLQMLFTQRARRSMTLKASYTYSKSLDIQSNGQTSANANPQPLNLHSQYAVSDFDSTHVFNLGWVWTLPKVSGTNRAMRALLNGWLYSGVYNARTGLPVNVTLAGDVSFNGEPQQRPNATPGVSQYLPSNRHRSCAYVSGVGTYGSVNNCKVQAWFNNVTVPLPAGYVAPLNNQGANTICVAPAAFCNVGQGTTGNVGRNSLRGPGFIATNMAIGRIFPLWEKGTSLEFKADAFNVFNTPNLANPSATLSNSPSNAAIGNFGVILATVGTNGNVGTNGRRMQMSLVLRY